METETDMEMETTVLDVWDWDDTFNMASELGIGLDKVGEGLPELFNNLNLVANTQDEVPAAHSPQTPIIIKDVMISSTTDGNLFKMNEGVEIPAYDSEPQTPSEGTGVGMPPLFEDFPMSSPSPQSPSPSPQSPSPSPQSPSPQSPSPSPSPYQKPSPRRRPAAGSRGSKRTRNSPRKQHVKCDLQKKTGPFECPDCGKKLKNKNGQRKHSVTHMPKDMLPYKCTYCPKTFGQRNNLTRHIGCKHELKNLPCRFCSKIFHRQDKLKGHEEKYHERGENGATKKRCKRSKIRARGGDDEE